MMNFKLWLEAVSKKKALGSARWAYWYAREIKNRFPEGEAVIAKDPEYAYQYALDVIKGRFPEGEAAIAKDPKWAYRYTQEVINKDRKPEGRWIRWPEGEAAIAKDPELAETYATRMIRGRWPEAEAAIAKVPVQAFWYARDVIKGRWPEAEAIMISDPTWGPQYLDFILGLVYKQIENFSDFVKHPDVIALSKNWPLLQKVINGSPKALRTFYMEFAPKHIRDMMLRYEA